MKGRIGEKEDGNRLSVQFGNVAQSRPGDIRLMEVMVTLQAPVELSSLMRLDEADLHALKQTRLEETLGGYHGEEA